MTRPEDGVGLVGSIGHQDLIDALRRPAEPRSRDLIPYCAHDWSMTGAEGPIRDLRARGRDWPILWNCDACGATLLDTGAGWVRQP